MIAGRSVVGAAVGSASFVVPLYISELAPGPFRGRLVVVSSLFITGGQVVAYLVGWGFSGMDGGWRWMVGLGALPAALQVLMLGSLPETPRWLVKAGRKEQARNVLARVYGAGQGMEGLVDRVLRKVEKEILEEEDAAGLRAIPDSDKTGWRAKTARISDNFSQLVDVGGNKRALIIACMLQGFQQLCGFVSLPSRFLDYTKTPLIRCTRFVYYLHANRMPELVDVLLGNHLLPRRVPFSYPDFALHRDDELPLHARSIPLH